MLYIGIDPGTITGLASWYPEIKLLTLISGTLIEVSETVKHVLPDTNNYLIRIEDARLRKWFGKQSSAKLQGAGSIKRDCAIWEEICKYHNWNYEMVHPIKGGTKWDANKFKKATGYQEQTNEHKRDAGLLVWGLK